MQEILQINPHVVWQWLCFLQVCHASYKDDPKLHDLSNFEEFKNVMQDARKEVFKGCVSVSSTRDIFSDLIVGDDIAQVRSGILTQSDLSMIKESQGNGSKENNLTVSHSLVIDGSPIHKAVDDALKEKEKMATHLKEIAEVFNIALPLKGNEEGKYWTTAREMEPVCSLTNMQELLVGAFPSAFMLGLSYPRKSLLNPQQMEHLLLQHTNAAATNQELLFYLFDCKS